MSLRCTYINYTEDALLNIIKNKENREIAMKKTLSSVGGELIGYYGLIGQESVSYTHLTLPTSDLV